MAPVPKPRPGLVFRYDFLRPDEARKGVENGKERPAYLLMVLQEGEVVEGVTAIDESGGSVTVDYVAREGDVLSLPIQTDPPGKGQVGMALSVETKAYVGMQSDAPSYVLLSEANIDAWPNAGLRHLPGRPGIWTYPRPLPGPAMAAVARNFLKVREARLVVAVVRHP